MGSFFSASFRVFLILFAGASVAGAQPAKPLPSWNEGPAKAAILKFVSDVTTEGLPAFVKPAERIAVFDNDGTLWAEQPMYVQMAFVLDRVKEMAPSHPDWKTTQPFKAVLDRDLKALAEQGEKGIVELVAATHTGMTSEEFHHIASDWIAKARHPKFQRPYTEVVYQPMLEVLAHLRANGFKTFIVSGGGVDFMRPWTERVYGIPPEQVVGSMGKLEFQMREGKPALMRLPNVDHLDDGPGKPVGIQKFIGRHPIAAFRNSDGDLQMLQYTAAGRKAPRAHRPSHRRRAGVGLRSAVERRQARQGARRGESEGLDSRGYEEGLEQGVLVPVKRRHPGDAGMAATDGGQRVARKSPSRRSNLDSAV